MQDLLTATNLVLALAKSKNVRNWRTYEGGDPANGKLKPSTIDRRMDRYGQSLGLQMGHDPIEEDGDVAPTPYKNRLDSGRMDEDLLTSEHELGHAMMTPPGKKMRSYFKWLHGQRVAQDLKTEPDSATLSKMNQNAPHTFSEQPFEEGTHCDLLTTTPPRHVVIYRYTPEDPYGDYLVRDGATNLLIVRNIPRHQLRRRV